MPTQVYEDTLTVSREGTTADTRIVVLENDYVKAIVAVDLARLLKLQDKRSGLEVFGTDQRLEFSKESSNALEHAGLGWFLVPEAGRSGAATDFQIIESDDEAPGGLWMNYLLRGRPLSYHIGVSLAPDRAELRFEIRSYNRSFESQAIAPTLTIAHPLVTDTAFYSDKSAEALYSPSANSGIVVGLDRNVVQRAVEHQPGASIHRYASAVGWLAPRQMDTWTIKLAPISGLDFITAASEHLAICVDETKLAIRSNARFPGSKVVLLLGNGQTVEAATDLMPERVASFSIESIDCEGVVVLSADRQEILRWHKGKPYEHPGRRTPLHWTMHDEPQLARGVHELLSGLDPRLQLNFVAPVLGLRSAALSALGIYEMRQNRFKEAADKFDDALLYNAEDHLTWWMKAMALRLAGVNDGERPELLNAHFLAPLEPALRAESFLSQEETSAEPSPLVRPLANNPDAMVEVACLLFDCGVYEDVSRWIHECLKHREVAMLRYILAAALLTRENLDAEAAHHVAAAARHALEPPYPWRETELRALNQVAKRFPADERIQELLKLAMR